MARIRWGREVFPTARSQAFIRVARGRSLGLNNMGPGSDLPIGLSMLLMEDPVAMQHFAAISKEERMQILKYVESGVNGDDAQRRIVHTVQSLHDGTPGFYR